MNKSFFNGLPVYVEPQRPRYTLPDAVPPPAGMTRLQFSEWSRQTCGFLAPIIPDGTIYQSPLGLHMNAATWRRVEQEIKKTGGAA